MSETFSEFIFRLSFIAITVLSLFFVLKAVMKSVNTSEPAIHEFEMDAKIIKKNHKLIKQSDSKHTLQIETIVLEFENGIHREFSISAKMFNQCEEGDRIRFILHGDMLKKIIRKL